MLLWKSLQQEAGVGAAESKTIGEYRINPCGVLTRYDRQAFEVRIERLDVDRRCNEVVLQHSHTEDHLQCSCGA